jgi:multimeric flavodoxin WrbA
MKVVAVNGSPRRNGNTHLLLEAVLAPLAKSGWDAELLQAGGKDIHGCRACRRCFRNQDRRCSYDDDDFNGIYEKLLGADAMVIGSPTYFADITPEAKAVIDRAGYVSMANDGLFAGKIGAGVVAVRRAGAIHALDSINHMFLICRMVVPGSTYWNIGFGREAGEVAVDLEGLANMNHLGRAIGWLGKAIAASGEPYPGPKADDEA